MLSELREHLDDALNLGDLVQVYDCPTTISQIIQYKWITFYSSKNSFIDSPDPMDIASSMWQYITKKQHFSPPCREKNPTQTQK